MATHQSNSKGMVVTRLATSPPPPPPPLPSSPLAVVLWIALLERDNYTIISESVQTENFLSDSCCISFGTGSFI